jgi:neutral ceramidase
VAWQAAGGRVDITPAPGTPMAGYGAGLGEPARTATGTFTPLQARALALWDAGRPAVVVSADVLGWSAAAATTVRQRVAAETDLPAARLLLTATHTHNGAALPGVLDPWTTYGLTDTTPLEAAEQVLVDGVVGLVTGVLKGPRQAVTVDHQVTSASFSANREGLSYVETAVPVLVARLPDGQPLGVLFGFGTHPVSAGAQTLWDGDFPAAAAAAVEAVLPGATAVFLPGPAGDQDPLGDRGWGLRSSLGGRLADAVLTAAVVPGRPMAGLASTGLTTVDLPLDVTVSPDNLRAVRDAFAARAAAGGLGWEVRHAQAMVQLLGSGAPVATAVTTPLQAWQLSGDPPLRMAFTGGELVSGFAVYLRQRFGGTTGLWIGGYGPGAVSYLPSDALLPPLRTGGSYASGWDPDHPGIAGGAMCIYSHLAHYRAGPGGVEPALIGALTALLG